MSITVSQPPPAQPDPSYLADFRRLAGRHSRTMKTLAAYAHRHSMEPGGHLLRGALLAVLLADENPLEPAEALAMVDGDVFDPAMEAAGDRRALMLSLAADAEMAAEYGETRAAATR